MPQYFCRFVGQLVRVKSVRFQSSIVSENIRVRFAPSPTGFLHLGGLRTLLYNFLLAKNRNGQLILRIEDTDQNRFVPGSVEKLEAVMKWVGVAPDEGPSQGGPYGPYVQSQRSQLYWDHAQKLLQLDAAYRCFCSPELLAAKRAAVAHRGGALSKYDGACRNLPQEEVESKLRAGQSHVVRLKVPECCEVTVDDVVFGQVTYGSVSLGDQVLLKSDGMPTYHLANVVDDHFMHISHVIRGEEWLSSTPKHILLYKAFGWKLPTFAHLPLLVDSSGAKLSKRKQDVFVEHFKEKGYLPEAVINLVGLLGWSQENKTSKFLTLEDMIKQFSLEGCVRTPSTVDSRLLMHLQQSHMRHLVANKNQQLYDDFRRVLLDTHADRLPAGIEQSSLWTDDYLHSVLQLMCIRAEFLKDIAVEAIYYWCEPDSQHLITTDPAFRLIGAKQLNATIDRLEKVDRFELDILRDVLKELLTTLGVKQRDFFRALRISLTGAKDGSPVVDVLTVVGKKRSLSRLENTCNLLSS